MHFNYSVTLLLIFLIASCGTINKPRSGKYFVKSDCPDAQSAGTLNLADSKSLLLDAFEVENAQQFGFPSNSFLLASSKLSSQGEKRECTALIFEDSAKSMLFACKEDNKIICSIHLEQ